jgi:pimeloyl-ACP methyl ester carboxylesterase
MYPPGAATGRSDCGDQQGDHRTDHPTTKVPPRGGDLKAFKSEPGREFGARQLELHGHRVIYRTVGSGPPVVLIHGMVNSSRHWESVALRLAEDCTVIAPDLIGHGDSATPRGDYSLGAHAAAIRDLLAAIGVDRATIVGHSLGGGVAMQFFWQFPERTERLVLVSSGGLGHHVSPLLRSAAVPGATPLLWLASQRRVVAAFASFGGWLRGRGHGTGVYLQATARALRPLERRGARQAFLQTLRSVIDVRGQRVSARDRLHLLDGFPTLIVWGERDNTIPLSHGVEAHEAIPGSRFETLPRAAHFPHLEDPEGLAAVLRHFLESTEPVQLDGADWGDRVNRRSRRRRPAPDTAVMRL